MQKAVADQPGPTCADALLQAWAPSSSIAPALPEAPSTSCSQPGQFCPLSWLGQPFTRPRTRTTSRGERLYLPQGHSEHPKVLPCGSASLSRLSPVPRYTSSTQVCISLYLHRKSFTSEMQKELSVDPKIRMSLQVG